MKKRIIIAIMAAGLMALPIMAQLTNEQQNAAGFQSTSTMTGSGSAYSSTPMLNEDGTATYEGAAGPKRAKLEGAGTPSTPGAGKPEDQMPLGDALLPMLLLALAYAGYKETFKRGIN